jgi:hypothetical protein
VADRLLFLSFPRRRESRKLSCHRHIHPGWKYWIPIFMGMTTILLIRAIRVIRGEQSHIPYYFIAELGTFQELGAVHQAMKVISHRPVADRPA